MKITVKVIPHRKHRKIGGIRYETVGDWKFDKKGDLTVWVSEMFEEKYEALVAVHEILEALLCLASGVSEESVSGFDMECQKRGISDPGAEEDSPYYDQHRFAESVEFLLARELGVDWREYMRHLDDL